MQGFGGGFYSFGIDFIILQTDRKSAMRRLENPDRLPKVNNVCNFWVQQRLDPKTVFYIQLQLIGVFVAPTLRFIKVLIQIRLSLQLYYLGVQVSILHKYTIYGLLIYYIHCLHI